MFENIEYLLLKNYLHIKDYFKLDETASY
ncbi:ATP-binding protein, partial [Campylobacter coli]|nr:ATP-binding protein [Campylobacter coli]EHK6839164.1 ATP-binding protein [Campylobacter coli]